MTAPAPPATNPFARLGGWAWNQAYLLLALTMLFWAFNTVLGRYVSGAIPPVGLAYMRWLGAGAIVTVLARRHLRADLATLRALPAPARRRAWGLMATLAFTGVTVYNTCLYIGVQYTSAINAVLIGSIGPVLVAGAAFLVDRERPSGRQMIGIAVSFAGVLIVLSRGSLANLAALEINRGDAWIAAGVFLYAFYSALLRRRPAIHPLSLLSITFALGALFLTPAFAWEVRTGLVPRFDMVTVLSVLYVAIVPSILAYLFFNRGVGLIGANRASPLFHLMPLFGSAIAVAWLGESLRGFHLAGWAVIVTGVVVATRRQGRQCLLLVQTRRHFVDGMPRSNVGSTPHRCRA